MYMIFSKCAIVTEFWKQVQVFKQVKEQVFHSSAVINGEKGPMVKAFNNLFVTSCDRSDNVSIPSC